MARDRVPDVVASRARRRGRRWRVALRYAALVVASTIVLFPIYAAIVVAIQPLSEFRDLGVLVPSSITLQPFADAWQKANLDRYLLNSLIVTTCITAAQVVTSVLAAYALTYLRFRGRRFLFFVILATLMVPTEVTLVGNFETIQRLGWTDTYAALVVPFLAWGFGIFLLRQAFLAVPGELHDAAVLDGYSHWGFLTRIVVPLARPSIAALAVFSFLLAWNQYLWPLLVTNDDSRRTVQVGLKTLIGGDVADLNRAMAGTLLAALPIALLLIVFERQLVRGLTAGAVKG
jgi:sn-glycerol 3-phosphate transport system permease protein